MNLDGGAPCWPMIHLIQEARYDTGVTREVIEFHVRGVSATRLSGTLHVPDGARLGEYKVKVFIGDKVKTSPNTVTVNGNLRDED